MTISITDPELFGEILSLVKGLGFEHGTTYCRPREVRQTGYVSKGFMRLRLHRAANRRFYEEVGFSVSHKMEILGVWL